MSVLFSSKVFCLRSSVAMAFGPLLFFFSFFCVCVIFAAFLHSPSFVVNVDGIGGEVSVVEASVIWFSVAAMLHSIFLNKINANTNEKWCAFSFFYGFIPCFFLSIHPVVAFLLPLKESVHF